MSAIEIHSEEPVRRNTQVAALDETSGQLELAIFDLDSVFRYRFTWTWDQASPIAHALDLLSALSLVLQQPQCLVAVWEHDEIGHMKFRHQNRIASLTKSGFDVKARQGLGLAERKMINPTSLHQHVAGCEDLGWFMAFGDWADQLGKAPFLKTIESFAKNHRLAPSREFLEGMSHQAGCLAYADFSDQQLPTLLVASSRPLAGDFRDVLSELSKQ